MKAVILAAGIASRLRPLTDNTPKCLLEIGEKSLLQRAIDGLISNGFSEFIIVTGYLQEKIISFIQEKFPKLNVTFIYNEKYASTNNIYSLWMIKEYVSGDDILLLDSDILFDPQLVKAVLNSKYKNSLALNNHPLGDEEIKVIPDENGFVKEINKTCNPADAIGESIGIEKMSSEYLSVLFTELDRMILQEKMINVFYEVAFERLISQGQTFEIVDITSYFSMELDTVEDFQHATDFIPEHLR